MFSRKEQSRPPRFLPDTWAERVRLTLQEAYAEQTGEKIFMVLGMSWPDELLLVVTLNERTKSSAPVTLLLSHDLSEKQEPLKSVDKLIDAAGLFFDEYFALPPEASPYELHWREGELRGMDFFRRVTREDVAATLAANTLLEDHSS